MSYDFIKNVYTKDVMLIFIYIYPCTLCFNGPVDFQECYTALLVAVFFMFLSNKKM